MYSCAFVLIQYLRKRNYNRFESLLDLQLNRSSACSSNVDITAVCNTCLPGLATEPRTVTVYILGFVICALKFDRGYLLHQLAFFPSETVALLTICSDPILSEYWISEAFVSYSHANRLKLAFGANSASLADYRSCIISYSVRPDC